MSSRSALLAAALAVALAGCGERTAAPSATATATSVSANGVTLTSVSATLPADDIALPAGPGVEAVQANCTSCHSPAMLVAQPPLTRAQWAASVEKMRTVYKAPVDAQAVPAILTYLEGLGATPR